MAVVRRIRSAGAEAGVALPAPAPVPQPIPAPAPAAAFTPPTQPAQPSPATFTQPAKLAHAEPALAQAILALVQPRDHVLDVGAGLESCYRAPIYEKAGRYLALDAHAPYLANARQQLPGIETRIGVAPGFLSTFPQGIFDVAIACDVLEHMTDEDAAATIMQLRRVAMRVIVLVPEGHQPQTEDGWNMGGEKWQTHRSEWSLAKLAGFGFQATTWPNFYPPRPGCGRNAIFGIFNA